MSAPAPLDGPPSAAPTAHPWNGSHTLGGGAVQTPTNSDGSQSQANNNSSNNNINNNNNNNSNNHATLGAGEETSGGEAMREGKQRAWAVLAQAQGLSGRKRSRDGTPRAAASAPDPAQHDAVLLDRYMQRDMLHAAAMNDQAERSRHLYVPC